MSRITALIVGIVLAITALAVTFVAGMRRKSPLVLNAVKRSSRAMKPLVLKSAGTAGASASVVRHVGRTSGRAYETPVVAVATDDGFAVALPYGPTTDWLKNAQAAGSATIVTGGSSYAVHGFEVVAIEQVEGYFPEKEQRQHRRFGVREAVRLRRADLDQQGGSTNAAGRPTATFGGG